MGMQLPMEALLGAMLPGMMPPGMGQMMGMGMEQKNPGIEVIISTQGKPQPKNQGIEIRDHDETEEENQAVNNALNNILSEELEEVKSE